MKRILKISIPLILASVGLLSSAFLPVPGGDKFEIYINNKLVVEQYVSMKSPVKHLTLQSSNYEDRIDVRYSHCGQVGTGRIITLKDEENKTLKKWAFANSKNGSFNMTWNVSEIMDIQKNKARVSFKLYYSSREIPEGKLLANVVMGNRVYARR